jgi:hypothetical protein
LTEFVTEERRIRCNYEFVAFLSNVHLLQQNISVNITILKGIIMENIRGQGDCPELKPPFLKSLPAIFLNCEIDHLGVLRAPYFSPFPLTLFVFYFFCCSYMQTIGRWRIFHVGGSE